MFESLIKNIDFVINLIFLKKKDVYEIGTNYDFLNDKKEYKLKVYINDASTDLNNIKIRYLIPGHTRPHTYYASSSNDIVKTLTDFVYKNLSSDKRNISDQECLAIHKVIESGHIGKTEFKDFILNIQVVFDW